MTTHFITAEVNIQESTEAMHQEIEAELQKRGEPLRWAVTDVNLDRQTAQIEAIVLVESTAELTSTSTQEAV